MNSLVLPNEVSLLLRVQDTFKWLTGEFLRWSFKNDSTLVARIVLIVFASKAAARNLTFQSNNKNEDKYEKKTKSSLAPETTWSSPSFDHKSLPMILRYNWLNCGKLPTSSEFSSSVFLLRGTTSSFCCKIQSSIYLRTLYLRLHFNYFQLRISK